MHTPPTFTTPERAATAWACACTLLMVDYLGERNDPEAAHLRGLLPDLPDALDSVKAGRVQAAQLPTLAAVLHGAVYMLDALPADVRAQLNPPPVADLRAALARAGGVDAGPSLRVVSA